MKELPKTQSEFLKDMIAYYSENTEERRCVSNTGDCTYHPSSLGLTKSEGCAIGRYIPEKLALRFDEKMAETYEGASVDAIYDELPEELKALGCSFLSLCQRLHDNDHYWTKTGLSDLGKSQVDAICRDFNLTLD